MGGEKEEETQNVVDKNDIFLINHIDNNIKELNKICNVLTDLKKNISITNYYFISTFNDIISETIEEINNILVHKDKIKDAYRFKCVCNKFMNSMLFICGVVNPDALSTMLGINTNGEMQSL